MCLNSAVEWDELQRHSGIILRNTSGEIWPKKCLLFSSLSLVLGLDNAADVFKLKFHFFLFENYLKETKLERQKTRKNSSYLQKPSNCYTWSPQNLDTFPPQFFPKKWPRSLPCIKLTQHHQAKRFSTRTASASDCYQTTDTALPFPWRKCLP